MEDKHSYFGTNCTRGNKLVDVKASLRLEYCLDSCTSISCMSMDAHHYSFLVEKSVADLVPSTHRVGIPN